MIPYRQSYVNAQGLEKSFVPYKAVYGSMSSHVSANTEIKQLYINDYFCYVFKFGIVTNNLGVIRHISFYNKDFFSKLPAILSEIINISQKHTSRKMRDVHGTKEWNNIYKLRTVVERDIKHIKEYLCLADKIDHHEYLKNLKPLIS